MQGYTEDFIFSISHAGFEYAANIHCSELTHK